MYSEADSECVKDDQVSGDVLRNPEIAGAAMAAYLGMSDDETVLLRNWSACLSN
jgi:hypothetical protein